MWNPRQTFFVYRYKKKQLEHSWGEIKSDLCSQVLLFSLIVIVHISIFYLYFLSIWLVRFLKCTTLVTRKTIFQFFFVVFTLTTSASIFFKIFFSSLIFSISSMSSSSFNIFMLQNTSKNVLLFFVLFQVVDNRDLVRY